MLRKIFVVLLTLLPWVAMSQGANSEGGADSKKMYWVAGEREDLPQWIYEPQGKGRYIGVSSPCLDSISGYREALLHGWFLSNVRSEGLNLELMIENYQRVTKIGNYDRVSARYVTFSRFVSSGSAAHFRVGRSHHSIFGEYYLEIMECDALDEGDVVAVEPSYGSAVVAEFVNHGSENSVVSSRIDFNLMLSAVCDGAMVTSSYRAAGPYGREVITRKLDGAVIPSSVGKLWYSDTYDAPLDVEAEQRQTPMRNGVWGAVVESMFMSVTSEPGYNYSVKQAQQSTDTDDIYSLTRSVYSGDVHFDFGGYVVEGDKMITTWSYLR